MFKKLTYAAVGLLACAGIAYAGGAFQGYPLIGGTGASNCLSFGNNAVCNQFQPAGPSALTGNETYPADTNVQGAGNAGNPATVAVPAVLLGAGASLYNAPLTGASITVPANTSKVVLDPAGTIATLTLVFPAATTLTDGQTLEVGSSNTVTALTITPGSGTTIAQNPTAITATTTATYGYKFAYVASVTKWIRLN